MKKTIFLVVIFLLGSKIMLFSQLEIVQEAKPTFKNEVKLNLPMAVFGSFIEGSYERLIDEDISFNVALGVGLDTKNNYPLDYALAPSFRWYFGGNSKSTDKYAAGFFIEANAIMFSLSQTRYSYLNNEVYP